MPTTSSTVPFSRPPLVGLAAVERYRLGALVDADEGEAELRLAGVALGVDGDERAADPPGRARSPSSA